MSAACVLDAFTQSLGVGDIYVNHILCGGSAILFCPWYLVFNAVFWCAFCLGPIWGIDTWVELHADTVLFCSKQLWYRKLLWACVGVCWWPCIWKIYCNDCPTMSTDQCMLVFCGPLWTGISCVLVWWWCPGRALTHLATCLLPQTWWHCLLRLDFAGDCLDVILSTLQRCHPQTFGKILVYSLLFLKLWFQMPPCINWLK